MSSASCSSPWGCSSCSSSCGRSGGPTSSPTGPRRPQSRRSHASSRRRPQVRSRVLPQRVLPQRSPTCRRVRSPSCGSHASAPTTRARSSRARAPSELAEGLGHYDGHGRSRGGRQLRHRRSPHHLWQATRRDRHPARRRPDRRRDRGTAGPSMPCPATRSSARGRARSSRRSRASPAPSPPRRCITFTSCHPRFSAKQRLIVHADLVEGRPRAEGAPPRRLHEGRILMYAVLWRALPGPAVVKALLSLVLLVGRGRRLLRVALPDRRGVVALLRDHCPCDNGASASRPLRCTSQPRTTVDL